MKNEEKKGRKNKTLEGVVMLFLLFSFYLLLAIMQDIRRTTEAEKACGKAGYVYPDCPYPYGYTCLNNSDKACRYGFLCLNDSLNYTCLNYTLIW